MQSQQIYTIGHSTHSIDSFLSLLRAHDIDTIVDVRSAPYSRFNPAFSREPLKQELKKQGLSYVFLGKELGGRPSDPACYEGGRADYLKMAATDVFRTGLERVIDGSASHRIALMCSEADPLDCHRALLIARSLADRQLTVAHIRRDGGVETHTEAEDRLICSTGLADNLLRTREEALIEAYTLQAGRVAYAEEPTSTTVKAR